MASIADIRRDYSLKTLIETEVTDNPFLQFGDWWQQAIESEIDEVNAMTLATSSNEGVPSARIVLLKGYDEKGFVFYTNYESMKGQELAENPRACLLFFWKELERQVRIIGLVEKVSVEESDEYFLSRPTGSQVGAWASPQSRVIENRSWLENRVKEMDEKFKTEQLTRPAHWGGYRVKPVIIEFWQGRSSRLHDRIQYTLQEIGGWKIERLAP
ncbi:pyridoxamine 5'-phosphate oxidase [Lacibacter luteus]|uniref:Pyridoxine/pyridoxamine 5'-phosphate oxidase n=1 Tax=Lacibacter luteus TaxID=2508719 RepID=A0A4Q1CHG3_9BACT|nr:pyridoxamine 5'-phosphate oxidase [Lacibacter luteus]RXK59417.1 pyridoxamine 5'-phosphate oxidase [Lacibacter luteus]